MFYSQCLLSRKGPLGAIWVAAYFFKKLKKAQVTETDITSSVDKILQDELNVVTYRVLAYLLLGVVRIYSKKVEYLFDDCHKVLIKINDFVVSTKDNTQVETLCAPYYSITLPDRFELDAFDLEILEDVSECNIVSRDEITLKDCGWKNVGKGQYSLDLFHCEKIGTFHDTCSTDYILADNVLSSHLMDIDTEVSTSLCLTNLEACTEKLQDNRFSQAECVNLEMSCEVEEEPSDPFKPFDDHQTSGEQIKVPEMAQSEDEIPGASPEKLQVSRSSMNLETFCGIVGEPVSDVNVSDEDHRIDAEQIKFPEMAQSEDEIPGASPEKLQVSRSSMNLETFCGIVGEPVSDVNVSDEDHRIDAEQIKVVERAQSEYKGHGVIRAIRDLHISQTRMEKFQDEEHICGAKAEPPELIRQFGEEHHNDTETIELPNLTSSRNTKCQFNTKKHPLSITIDGTPQSKFPDASGAATPEFMVIRTPANRERARISRKRKCLIDESIVLPNEVLRQSIHDARDLVSKRRKSPRSALAAWKACRIYSLPQSLLEPLMPCISLELRSLFCQKKWKILESAETVETPKKLDVSEFPTMVNSEKIGIAPETPVQRTTSVRLFESPELPNKPYSEGVRPPSSFQSVEKEPCLSKDQELDVNPYSEGVRPPSSFQSVEKEPCLSKDQELDVNPYSEGVRPPSSFQSVEKEPCLSKDQELDLNPYSEGVRPPSSFQSIEKEPCLSKNRELDVNPYSEGVGPPSSFQSVEKEPCLSKDQELDLNLMNEEINSCEADNLELLEGWSGRTRLAARYLNKSFLNQNKRREEEVVSLSRVLEGRTKKESARLFYEILVLRTTGYVDVKHDNATGEILVWKLPKWDQTCGL